MVLCMTIKEKEVTKLRKNERYEYGRGWIHGHWKGYCVKSDGEVI